MAAKKNSEGRPRYEASQVIILSMIGFVLLLDLRFFVVPPPPILSDIIVLHTITSSIWNIDSFLKLCRACIV